MTRLKKTTRTHVKTFAPPGLRGCDLPDLMAQLCASPQDVAKFLGINDRTVFRYLADESCPWPSLALLWHETPGGRYACALDVANELAIIRGYNAGLLHQVAQLEARLSRVLGLVDAGCANDVLMTAPRENSLSAASGF